VLPHVTATRYVTPLREDGLPLREGGLVRPGPVHTGLTGDAEAEADRLLRLLVRPVSE